MSRKDRLIEVYEHLRTHYPIHTKNDFAEKIKYHRTYISSAMNGNEKYLTDKLFMNICETFPNEFSLDYLLTGEGQLLVKNEKATDEQIEKLFKPPYIEKLITSLEKQIKDKDNQLADKERIIKLLEQKIEVLEAMQHIDSGEILRSPFPIGVADSGENASSEYINRRT